jgi:hypothetical protein
MASKVSLVTSSFSFGVCGCLFENEDVVMSNNTVTYWPGTSGIHSLQAPAVAVAVDGYPAPWLEMLEVTRNRGLKLNHARFRLVPHGLGPEARMESMAQTAEAGQRIQAVLTCMADTAGGNQLEWPLFTGVIIQGQADVTGKGEEVEIVAVDESAYKSSTAIDGVRGLGYQDKTVYIRSNEAVFNPNGKGNCSLEVVSVNGKNYHVFDLNTRTACYWTCAAAIRYIAGEYLPESVVSLSSLAAMESLIGGRLLRDVDVFGLSPLAAIDRLCQRVGLHYRIVHVSGAAGEIKEVLQFYRRGQGRQIFLHHQKPGRVLDTTRTNLVSCRLKIDRAGTSIQAIGRGALKRFEGTFDLVEGWDQSQEMENYELYSPVTNDEFADYRDVFRKYVLNETGEYGDQFYGEGEAYDLSGLFSTDNYSLRPRRFWPCLSRSLGGESFGYYLEVSYDGGESWGPYGGAFNILLEECGIYLSSNQLDPQVWAAIYDDKLRFRITASIDSDETLEAIICDGPVDCTRGVRTVIFDLGNEYKYRQVRPGSIFAGSSAIETGPPDVVDDSENIRGQLREQLARVRQDELAGTVKLTFVRPEVWPGDVVRQISGREVDLRQWGGPGEALPQVDKVRITLADQWTTTISFGS